MPSVTVETPANVDVARIGSGAPMAEAVVAAEQLTMEQYAAVREAERFGKPAPVFAKKDAVTPTEEEPAANATATEETNAEVETPTESATEAETDPVETLDDAAPQKKGIQKRFSELTKERETARAEAAAAKELADKATLEATQAREALAKLQSERDAEARAVPKAEDDPAPDRSTFDDPDEYVKALSAHTAREALRQSIAAADVARKVAEVEAKKVADEKQQAEVSAKIVELHKNFQDRVTEAAPEYPDYDTKVRNNEKLVLRNDVFFMIEKAPLAPHILYHIASTPELAVELNQLDPMDVGMRLGEIQAEIRAKRKPQASRAAAPIKAVGNRQSPQSKSPDEETMAEYAARREREDREAHARKYPSRSRA